MTDSICLENELMRLSQLETVSPYVKHRLKDAHDTIVSLRTTGLPSLAQYRERMIQAVIDRHVRDGLTFRPDIVGIIGVDAAQDQCRAEVETYRPYAARDVDAIIAAITEITLGK